MDYKNNSLIILILSYVMLFNTAGHAQTNNSLSNPYQYERPSVSEYPLNQKPINEDTTKKASENLNSNISNKINISPITNAMEEGSYGIYVQSKCNILSKEATKELLKKSTVASAAYLKVFLEHFEKVPPEKTLSYLKAIGEKNPPRFLKDGGCNNPEATNIVNQSSNAFLTVSEIAYVFTKNDYFKTTE